MKVDIEAIIGIPNGREVRNINLMKKVATNETSYGKGTHILQLKAHRGRDNYMTWSSHCALSVSDVRYGSIEFHVCFSGLHVALILCMSPHPNPIFKNLSVYCAIFLCFRTVMLTVLYSLENYNLFCSFTKFTSKSPSQVLRQAWIFECRESTLRLCLIIYLPPSSHIFILASLPTDSHWEKLLMSYTVLKELFQIHALYFHCYSRVCVLKYLYS